ncbi:hypothetical protein HHI36_015638 [Cryptolaemus montrouzieri]|uniref:C2H2-type domain-containing protein n=1 Tax=Cryptolaemus montrouzieri TaxID=559131 RepID=A0ABD2N709_9CUCU
MNMEIENELFKCPFCCDETFDSFKALKEHILDIRSKLNCPLCMENFSDFNTFTFHLDECEARKIMEENETISLRTIQIKQSNEIGTNVEVNTNNQFYCEICKVFFREMKKHLMGHHMGQEVIVESQDLENVLEESEIDIDQENGMDDELDIKPDLTSDSEHIFLEQEVLDENGQFFTKKLTKINIVQNTCKKPPILEHIVFLNGNVTEVTEDVNVESGLKVYRCQDCNIRFAQFTNYNRHNCELKQGEVCEICSIYFTTKGALSYHKRKLHSEMKEMKETTASECDICHIVFPSKKSMNIHKKMHAPVSRIRKIDPPATYNIVGKKICEEVHEMFTCQVCQRQYNRKYKEIHMKSHVEELFNCPICNRKFANKNDLSMHAQAHGNEVDSKVSCGYCKRVFTNKESLSLHIENQCEGGKYVCNYCGKKFSRPHEKVKHERIHTGQKPHVCEVCGKGFRVSYCLTLHLRTHSGIRPYHCKTCGKRFKSHSVYNHHLQTHSDARPYQCPFCPKTFKTSVQLAGHKNTHTKPFTCNVCNRPFASLYAVRLHTQSHDRRNNLIHQCHICGAVYARYFALRDHLVSHPEHTKEDLERVEKKMNRKKNQKLENEGNSEDGSDCDEEQTIVDNEEMETTNENSDELD